jgi:hypothetical protein
MSTHPVLIILTACILCEVLGEAEERDDHQAPRMLYRRCWVLTFKRYRLQISLLMTYRLWFTLIKCVAKIWRNFIVCVKILNIFWKVIKIVNLRANTDGKYQKCYFCGHFLTCTITLQSKAGDTISSSHVSSCDVNVCSWDVRCDLTLRLLMSYIYGAPILDVSRSHTTTQHSR